MPPRDPDETLVALFKHHSMPNEARSAAEGRPIFDDIEVVEIRAPGSRNSTVQPATALSTGWIIDPFTGNQKQITYAERFPQQYQQFKAKAAQTKSGTPLDHVPFLTPGRCAELRAQNIYTLEQLAAVEGTELKNLGPGGRDMKNSAVAYMEESRANSGNTMLAAELEAMKARQQVLEDDLAAARAKLDRAAAEERFEDMSEDQLREYVQSSTGHAPTGKPNRKTLLRMAIEARPDKVA